MQRIRFVQALALVAACGGEVAATPASPGKCLGTFTSATTPVACGAGNQCGWDVGSGTAICTAETGGAACGVIRCGAACTCKDALASTCACAGGIAGPQSPPELA